MQRRLSRIRTIYFAHRDERDLDEWFRVHSAGQKIPAGKTEIQLHRYDDASVRYRSLGKPPRLGRFFLGGTIRDFLCSETMTL